MRSFLAALALLLLASSPFVNATELTLQAAIEAAIRQSAELEQSELRIASSELREIDVEESVAPSLSISADPLYSIVTQRVPEVTGGSDTTPGSNLGINSTGVGLDLSQPLPTGGIVSGALGLGLSATLTNPDSGDRSLSWSLNPALSIAISQPLFVGDGFIEAEQPALILEQARRATLELRIASEATEERIAGLVVALYAQLGTLQRSERIQQAQRELVETRIEQAAIRRETGIGSREDELELQVQLNQVDNRLLQSVLAQREIALELARLTGGEVGANVQLEPIGILEERVEEALANTESALTPAQRSAQEARTRAEVDLVLARKQPRATATTALSVEPRYQDARERDDQLLGALTDFAGDGAGVDLVWSLGFSVPLGERATREREVQQAQIALELSRSEEARLADEVAYQRELFALRAQNVRERIALSQFEIEFQRAQLENELELISLGVSTQTNADVIQSDILALELALEDLRAQLFLTNMDLAAATGLRLQDVVAIQ